MSKAFRKYAVLTPEELKYHILECVSSDPTSGGGFDPNNLVEYVADDLKVKFDLENFDGWNERFDDLGPKSLGDFNFWVFQAGGDWEHPVKFLVYFDGKRLRAYIPTKGNPYNRTTKQAYGNDEKADLEDVKKWYPNFPDDEDVAGWVDFDEHEMLVDVAERFGIDTRHPGSKEQDPPKKAAAKAGRKTLRERIEALVFRGGPDEASELFQTTCSYCYKLYGLGMADEAAVVCGWAEKMAEATKDDDIDSTDVVRGYWG